MRLVLTPHPETPPRRVDAVVVKVHGPRGREVRVDYEVRGRLEELLVPAAGDPGRTDDLWRRTCFEAFAREVGAQCYDEFNFSPSTQWAVYRFEGYRTGMTKPDAPAPRIEVGMEGEAYVLNAVFELPGQGPWAMGLAAVIKEADGTKSYWALKHPTAKPDFHHGGGFVLELA
jgi:hypothetical protein